MKFPLRFGSIALLCALALVPAWAQCPPQTTVADTIYSADGSLAEGRVVIAWPTFQAGACQVVAGQVSVPLVAGSLSVPLYPNDAATPAGTSYRVSYHLKSGRITTEYWVVPSSAAPVSLALVRSPSVPIPAVMVSQSQVTNLVADLAAKVALPSPCPAGKFLQANGSSTPPQVSCVDGTGAPLASSTQSGTVKTDASETDPLVYTKASADALLAAKAAVSHSHSAADTTTGTFDPARLPAPAATSLGGVRSGACSGTDKMSGISTAGVIQCAADQTGGGGGGGSQHQANGTNLAANDPINFQDTATIAFSNPSAGNLQAALQDSAVTAAKLAAANPSAAQLSGIDDDNVAAAALSPNRIAGTAEVQSNKGAANGYASLNSSSLVSQNPSSAQVTPAASKIPISDGAGKLDDGWLSSNVSLLGPSISLTSEVSGVLPASNTQNLENLNGTLDLASGGTGAATATAARSTLGVRYGIHGGMFSIFGPADSQTYYIGFADDPQTVQGDNLRHRLAVPVAGSVERFCVWTYVQGTLGSGENVTFVLRKNGTTDSSQSVTQTWNAAERGPTCVAVSGFTLAQDDMLSLKLTTPAFATNPTQVNVRFSLTLLQDQ